MSLKAYVKPSLRKLGLLRLVTRFSDDDCEFHCDEPARIPHRQ